MSQIQGIGNQVGMSSQQIINAIKAGNCQIASKLADCCCENRLAICQQTNTLQNAINGIATGQERGFSSVAYETQRQTCGIQNSIKSATDAILADGTKISFPNITIKDLYASGNIRNQFWLGYDKDRFSNHVDSLSLELGYSDSDNNKANYKSTIRPGIISLIHYADGDEDKYVQISYNGITKKDGKSTEVFSANGGTYDITQKLDVSASITEDDIKQLFAQLI